MAPSKRRTLSAHHYILVILLCSMTLLGSTSCGEGIEGDVIYMRVFNGYAAGNPLSLYGPTGPVAQNLLFGESSEIVPVNRSYFDGRFTMLLQGSPGNVTIPVDLFAL